jgi:hypothetical protein
MNIQELKSRLESIVQADAIGVNVFFVMKTGENSFILKKANIRNDATSGLIESLTTNIQSIIQEIDANDEFRVINLSETDDRSTAIYEYDLDEPPITFSFFEEITNHRVPGYFSIENQNIFSFETDELSDIDGYIIRIGNENNFIMLYRKNYPINVFKQGKIYFVKDDETQFTTMKNDFLRIDAKIDFFKIDNSVFIKNLEVLEKFSDFHQIIVLEATNSINQVMALGLVENIEVLTERIDELPFARKLTKISTTSPVFTLPKATILEFARNHRLLANTFRYSANGSIILDTKKSQNLFVRLLNDDFLHSELTNTDYITPAKDKLE